MFEEITNYLGGIYDLMVNVLTVMLSPISNFFTIVYDYLIGFYYFSELVKGTLYQIIFITAEITLLFFIIGNYIQTHFWLIFIVIESLVLMYGCITEGFLNKLFILLKVNFYLILIPILIGKWIFEQLIPDWI